MTDLFSSQCIGMTVGLFRIGNELVLITLIENCEFLMKSENKNQFSSEKKVFLGKITIKN